MPKPSDVGIIVGRFQVHRLHDAHLQLIQSVYNTHAQTLIVLGLSQVRVSTANPLDFEARKQMILAAFPKATVLYIQDEPTDNGWSAKLDQIISNYASPAQSVCLYGGRDSFIARYHGKHRTELLEPDVFLSGTELRRSIRASVKASEDFRAGVIWATGNGYPKVFPTVDVAIYRNITIPPGWVPEQGGDVHVSHREWLLVRKPTEKKWRFCGGFVNPTDVSLEAAAKREASEETGVELGPLTYVASILVDDWRYRGEVDKIMTTLFSAPFIFGPVQPADDIAEAQWFDERRIYPEVLIEPVHLPLYAALAKGRV